MSARHRAWLAVLALLSLLGGCAHAPSTVRVFVFAGDDGGQRQVCQASRTRYCPNNVPVTAQFASSAVSIKKPRYRGFSVQRRI